jgi:hypothetical protein
MCLLGVVHCSVLYLAPDTLTPMKINIHGGTKTGLCLSLSLSSNKACFKVHQETRNLNFGT